MIRERSRSPYTGRDMDNAWAQGRTKGREEMAFEKGYAKGFKEGKGYADMSKGSKGYGKSKDSLTDDQRAALGEFDYRACVTPPLAFTPERRMNLS